VEVELLDEWDPGDPAQQYVENYLGFLDEIERDRGQSSALRLRLLDGMRLAWEAQRGGSIFTDGSDIESRSMRAEMAAALRIPERSVVNLLAVARALVHTLTETLQQLYVGNISERHARVLADETAGLNPEQTAELEQRALPHAKTLTVGKFERKVRVLRELIAPAEMVERHRVALEARELSVSVVRNGMGDLYAHLELADALAIDNYVDAIVDSLIEREGETRTRAQLRADVFADLLLDRHLLAPPRKGEAELSEPSRPRGIVPTVHATVPALTLAGVDDTPGVLEGQHPIDPETARKLVGAGSSFYRILTHPETGATLSFGRDRYQVPAALRRYLIERDATCRFVGCNRVARSCDIDHIKDWQWEGCTDCGNLAHACRGHHRIKHVGGWKVEQDPDGSGGLTWTSPHGAKYRTEPNSPPATLFPLARSKRPPGEPPGSGAIAMTRWFADDPPF
jgi:hypothetical protein